MKLYPSLLALALSLQTFQAVADAPRLVLQITVDGLRADLLSRYEGSFGDGGFRYLKRAGAVFTNTHYLHANTETIVGHTTLATGATPAVHGMIGNVWYQGESGGLGYNIEDAQAPLLPTRQSVTKGAQLDPAQKRARSSGRSPRNILVPTFSDTLKIATMGKGKNFGISGKDRGAVAMAGHSGTAYWYSTDTGDFQTSSYYQESYPQWVSDWNDKRFAAQLGDTSWQLLLAKKQYLHAEQDDRPYEVDLKGYGRTFPHNFGPVEHPLFSTRVLVSPEGDRLLADFGKTLLRSEGLGTDDVTDYLSISFSSVDAVNHFFGPGSLENEDVVLQLDRTLEDLLEFVDDTVGLKNTLIVLSADHGMAEMPEYTSAMGYPAGRLYGDQILKRAREISLEHFGNADLVQDFFRPYIYLNAEVIEKNDLSRTEIAATIARVLKTEMGIGGAVTAQEASQPQATGTLAAVAANHHPQRAGDVYVFQRPFWFLFDRGPVAAMHGSPWNYDNHVPLIFAGPGVRKGTITRLVHPIDVAPTLSAILRIPAPAASQGSVLPEAILESN
jgi:predicted AlkP superfamily pyrophosphatase or phosphodiesterase